MKEKKKIIGEEKEEDGEHDEDEEKEEGKKEKKKENKDEWELVQENENKSIII